ncbi:MAG: hypothetical protein HKO63_06575 [Acidimicrobiia bacterium]|nr:hypothetical protein [Acidimicrobiia bacterium]NNL97852.1 hypothetical protein [Acidimicrobiia bacterium]
MKDRRVLALVAGLALVAVSCGLDTVSDPTSTAIIGATTTTEASTSSTTDAVTASTTVPVSQVLVVDGTVLDKKGVGPQLCMFVRDSLPPQCEGLPVVGLNWRDVDWAETAGDTTWADARLIGRFKGGELVLTERPLDRVAPAREQPDYSTPCAEPEGGWIIRNDALATEDDFQRANEYAQRQPEFTGTWFDHLQQPKEFTPLAESSIANFSFTSNLDRHRSEIENLYGGPMCVSEGKRPLAELRDIQDRVFDAIFTPQAEAAGIFAGFGASGSADQFKGVVEVSVMYAGDDAQQWLDERFGPGVVELHSFLQPYEGPTESEMKPLFPEQEALPVAVWVQGTTYDLRDVPTTAVLVDTSQPPVFLPSGVLAVDPERTLTYTHDDGESVVLGNEVGDFIVSADESRVAWTRVVEPAPPGITELNQATLPDGTITHVHTFQDFDIGEGPNGYARVVTYAGDNIVLATGDGAASAAAVWVLDLAVVIEAEGYGTTDARNSAGNRTVLWQGDGTSSVIVEVRPDGAVGPSGLTVRETIDWLVFQAPTFSPDGSLLALGGTDGEEGPPIVLLTDSAGNEVQRSPILEVTGRNPFVSQFVWQHDATLLVLVGSWSLELTVGDWPDVWGIYQCDLEDTGCHLQQEINFEPDGWNQVGLVRLP